MKHIKKALLDTLILAGMFVIFAIFQKSLATYRVLIPITGVLCYNLIKAAYFIYKDKRNGNLN